MATRRVASIDNSCWSTSHSDIFIRPVLAATGSAAPIVRANWFLVQASRQLSLSNKETGAGYYNFLGVKNRDDFFKLVKLPEKGHGEVIDSDLTI